MEPQAQLLFLMSILVVQDNSVCLKFVSSPQDLVFVLGKNTTNVVMRWKFTLESQEFTTSLALTRLKSADDSNPPQLFAYSFNPGVDYFDANFYNASKDFKNGPSSGSFNFTIKDMLKQINNRDGSPYTPLSTDYQYKLTVVAFTPSRLQIESRVTALVYAPPVSPALQVDKTTFCINATVNITCTATTGNPPNTTVMFYRNDVKIREVKNDREAKATVSINLDKLGVQTFTCQAANLIGSSKNSSLLNVTVKGPPTITQCDNQTSTEGDALSWTCNARGSQPLNTSWVKGDGNTIVSSVKTYNISSVSRSDAGMYRVTVSNGDECPTASTTVHLTVQYKPEQLAVVNSQGGVLYVNKGQPINITCTAIGNPNPDYVWMFKGKQLLHSPLNCTIIINNATLDDAGVYTCTAINSIGRESINVTLQVNYLMDASCGPKIHTVNDGDNVHSKSERAIMAQEKGPKL